MRSIPSGDDLAVKSLELGSTRARLPGRSAPRSRVWVSAPNPVGMAAGFDKDARVFAPLLATGFGFVEVGTLTPKAQKGNPAPRIFRSAPDAPSSTGSASTTRVRRRPCRGSRAAEMTWSVNIGAGRDSEDRIGDYISGIARMSPVADYLTINISSPNTPGLRDYKRRRCSIRCSPGCRRRRVRR